jgi:hypothetical protein
MTVACEHACIANLLWYAEGDTDVRCQAIDLSGTLSWDDFNNSVLEATQITQQELQCHNFVTRDGALLEETFKDYTDFLNCHFPVDILLENPDDHDHTHGCVHSVIFVYSIKSGC